MDDDKKTEAEERAAKEKLAREANNRGNQERLDRFSQIADSADEHRSEQDALQDVTEEVNDDPHAPRKKTRAELLEEQDAEEDADAASVETAEVQDKEADTARDAGADDSRKRKDGTTEYRVGDEWLTLSDLRARAGAGDGEEDLQGDGEGDTTTAPRRPSPADVQARREAEERQRAASIKARKDKIKDLLSRASMGDDEAIDELADMQSGSLEVTPERLERMVDERVDARVAGQSAWKSTVDWFEKEFSDVLISKTLKLEAARRDADMARANPDMTPRQRLKSVGEQMRALRTEFGGAAPKDPPRNRKLERKQSVPQVPDQAGSQRRDEEPEERESAGDAIRRLAQSRGQTHAIKH